MKFLPKDKMSALLTLLAQDIPFRKYRQYLIIKTLALTGVRVSELVNMRPEHLLPNSSQIFVPAGKGASRNIDVPVGLMREIIIYSKSHYIHKKGQIFPVSRQSIGSITRKRADMNPHAFRHSYAVALLRETGNIRYVSKQLGHASIKATGIYLQYMEFDREKKILEDLFR